jgi:hypothetical protein
MWETCDRCKQRFTTDATVVELQHGEVVSTSQGIPRLKAAGTAEVHTFCRPCGRVVAARVQQLMDPDLSEQPDRRLA